MPNDNFEEQQRRAVERMREMNRRSSLAGQTPHNIPPSPSFVRINKNPSEHDTKSEPAPPKNDGENRAKDAAPPPQSKNGFDLSGFLKGLDIPFLGKITESPDSSLIIILLLLLWNDKADRLLLAALAYILL